ncbi:sensor domain-containing diguanylate cyclase [Paenibacillus soyae]|uniref:Diguanylate cyclase n=1 Tax=Paenibacillus soyae TaxID=2969249 RepID=A0A9X2MPI7_9BACL|nr:diguanylate cyclase [Paenibacillus soyae]MCR2804060.1 diguanylate cyclase [Paenibacillus soyae]
MYKDIEHTNHSHVFRQMIDHMLNGAILTDKSKRIIYVNPAFTQLTGYTLDEVLGKNPNLLKSGRHDQAFFRDLWHQVDTIGYWVGEVWNRKKDGEIFAEYQNIYSLKGSDGEVQYYAAVFSDISENKRNETKLKQRVYIDELTCVYNRRYFNERIDGQIKLSKKKHHNFYLFIIDIDYFKFYNDHYGHIQGDHCLIKVASALSESLQKGERLSRFGGEEFVITIPELEEKNYAAAADRFLNAIRHLEIPHAFSPIHDFVTISIGAACLKPEQKMTSIELLNRADTALYRAKQSGRNQAASWENNDEATGQEDNA